MYSNIEIKKIMLKLICYANRGLQLNRTGFIKLTFPEICYQLNNFCFLKFINQIIRPNNTSR